MSENRQTGRSIPGMIAAMETEIATATFQVSALPTEFARRIRERMEDDAGNRLTVRRDGERHQCRHCLRLTEPGEGFILLSYSPFSSRQPYAEHGPIFIHERNCSRYDREREYPEEFPRKAVVLRGYNAAEEIVGAEYAGGREVEDVIGELFADARVSRIHARNSTYGCFMFRIDRG
jgi:hypothetical protein